MPRTGMLKLTMKFVMRSHNDHTYLETAMMAASHLPTYISQKRLNRAFDEVVA